MMHSEDEAPLTEEELRLSEQGEALIAAAVAEVDAPQSLREAIERDRERAVALARPSLWRRGRWALASVGAIAVTGVAVGIALDSGDGAPAPTLAMVESQAGGEATEAAPALEGGDPPTLAANVGALEFPDWRQSFGWRAVGRRDDEVSGRAVTTVFYRNPDGARLGYSVVAGAPLGEQPTGREVTRSGDSYTVAHHGNHTLVTWTQQGHSCVIVAPATVPDARLVDLAASRNS